MSFWGKVKQDERGVTAVVVAVSLVAIFGAAMLSVDAGNLFQSRRNIITGTDATALSEARAFALYQQSISSCNMTNVNTMLTRNSGSALGSVACTPNTLGTTGTGYVTVTANKPVDVRFGGAVGVPDTTAASSSTAQWGFVTQVAGLRPMGFCLLNEHIQEWLGYQHLLRTGSALSGNPIQTLNDWNTQPPLIGLDGRIGHPRGPGATGLGTPSYTGRVHRMYFQRITGGSDCGGAPGNWGWFDFNGGSNSTADQTDWLLNGYDSNVGVLDCNADGTQGDGCSGDPGSSGSSGTSDLNSLISTGQQFAIPIFSTATAQGALAQFNIVGFVGVILRSYDLTIGQQNRYFDMEFQNLILEGNCCSSAPNDFGIKGVKLCSVDHDPIPIATRCQL
jgi:Flp pilus assembly protein TadG